MRIEELSREIHTQDSLKNFAASLRLSNELLKIDRKNLKAMMMRIKAMAGLGDSTSALAELDKMIDKYPNDQVYMMKAIYYLDKNISESVRLAHASLEINEDQDRAHSLLAGIYTSEISNRDSALYYVRILEQKKAEDPVSLMMIENAYLKYGTPQQLLDATTKLIEKSPEEPYPYNNRGYAEIKLKMFSEARRDIQRSLSIDSNNSYAYKNLALLFIELKQKDSACFHLQTARAKGFKANYGNEVDSLIAIHCQ